MYSGTYFHDVDNLHRSIVRENRYPPLNGLMRGKDMRAVGRAVFRPVDKQPLPHVLTAFDVVVGETGYIFAQHDGRGNGGVRRINRDRHPESHESFRPIQCLYRCVRTKLRHNQNSDHPYCLSSSARRRLNHATLLTLHAMPTSPHGLQRV
jgi:hypothetical protein